MVKKRVAPKWRHFWYKSEASKISCLRTHAMISWVDIFGNSNLCAPGNAPVKSCVKAVRQTISLIKYGV